MRQISKEGIQVLLDNGILKNTKRGYVDPRRKDESGSQLRIGYYRTVKGRHRYIEDSYANQAEKLLNKRSNK